MNVNFYPQQLRSMADGLQSFKAPRPSLVQNVVANLTTERDGARLKKLFPYMIIYATV